ncbi:patatin-like phospholipase family protein [Halomonas sp. 1390]|uniref:patatin-like phospholipase family protein n=1 Tax=Halomonas sp. B23F22_3 TaxID=3459516 RepID=UPI00373FB5A2
MANTAVAVEIEGSHTVRPKVGLALSGGGARGAAHIGVLRVLEELQVPVDYIAGTSMGSIVGGLYASGMTPDAIENALKEMDWEHIFSDSPPRVERSFRRKRDDDLYLVKASMGISDDGEPLFPTGAIQGQKFDLALRELSLPATHITDFDRLQIPFRAVASDIGNGRMVVLGEGDLATAMRASMAVPGIFSATEIDGRLLVDGGITGNLPVDVARGMGADIVIAVDISTPIMQAEDVNNLFAITGQLTSLMTRNNVEEQIKDLTASDILIVPDLEDFSSADFVNATDAVPIGYQAADARRQALGKLSLTAREYQAHLAARASMPSRHVPIIQFININNDSRISDEMIRDRIRQATGSPLDRKQLEQDIGRIYGLELFQNVRYDLVEHQGQTGLLIDARAKSWGPNYLQFGLDLSSDIRGDNSYDLGASYLRTGINPLGGEVRLATQVGQDPLLAAEWHQPLDSLSRYFIYTAARYGAISIDIFDGRRDSIAEYRVKEANAELALGRELSVYGESRIGYRYRSGDVDVKTGPPDSPEFDYDGGQAFARLSVDRLDNYNFPENGWLGSVQYDVAREDLGGDNEFEQIRLAANGFTSLGNGHVVGLGGLSHSTISGSADVQDRYRIGGFLNLSGYTEDSLSGQQAGVLSAIYYRRFEALPFLPWYLGGSFEYGGVWEDKEELFDDGIFSGSVFLGADSPIGPLYIGYGHAEGGYDSIFFYLGRPQFQ